MFIGHFAPAFVAAALGPRAPRLATVFIAAQLVDWAFFIFALLGIEKVRVDPEATVMVPLDLYYYPFTHSALGTAVWAIAFGVLIYLITRNRISAALSGAVVFSHYLLDLLVHRPDLTLHGSEPYLGLGLWNYPAIAMPLELALTLSAFAYYVYRTRGPLAPPYVLLAVLLILQATNWFAPHPQEAGLVLYLQGLIAFGVLTALAAWVGENRQFARSGGLAASSA